MSYAIRVENLGKRYQLGMTHAGSVRELVNRTVGRLLGRKHVALPHEVAEWTAGRPDVDPDGSFWALRDVSFEVKPGEVVGIIGRNGAGKSTLLKILSRITSPTHGRVELRGRVASLLEVGTGFHQELSGRENVFLNGAILGMTKPEIRRKFDEIVAFAEIEEFIDTPVKRYSSGMYVRLAFAVAAHLEPEILIVDEVLAVGDMQFQKKCFGKIGEIGRQGRTILLVSHNMATVINLCNRAIFLESGRNTADGQAEDVAQRYIASLGSHHGEVVWRDPATAPGNDVVRLHAVRLRQNGAAGPTADVDITQDIVIEIDYWNLRDGSPLYGCIWLTDQLDIPVLASHNAPGVCQVDDPWYGRPHPKGLFRCSCGIPGNFLNDKFYTVTAIIGEVPHRPLAIAERAIGFHVHDVGDMRGGYIGNWIGNVRPRLDWRTKCLGEERLRNGHAGI